MCYTLCKTSKNSDNLIWNAIHCTSVLAFLASLPPKNKNPGLPAGVTEYTCPPPRLLRNSMAAGGQQVIGEWKGGEGGRGRASCGGGWLLSMG